jgi:signal transduction histidine kinase
LQKQLQPLTLSFHQHLAEILISNLLNNMIKYTPENGTLSIELNNDKLLLRNTASNGALNKDKVFQRFYKDSSATDGTGLGLAIIKEICHLAGYEVTYSFIEQQHDFTIHFNS